MYQVENLKLDRSTVNDQFAIYAQICSFMQIIVLYIPILLQQIKGDLCTRWTVVRARKDPDHIAMQIYIRIFARVFFSRIRFVLALTS